MKWNNRRSDDKIVIFAYAIVILIAVVWHAIVILIASQFGIHKGRELERRELTPIIYKLCAAEYKEQIRTRDKTITGMGKMLDKLTGCLRNGNVTCE
jgi:hypothetical protein